MWKVSLLVSPETEEPIAEVLREIFGQAATVYVDADSGKVVTEVFVPTRPAESLLTLLDQRIANLREWGLRVGGGRVTLKRLRYHDWAEAWKGHFKPIEIGKRLLIRPSWSKRRARPGQRVVVLDPGLGFGTGQHATTRFCLEQIVANRRADIAQSFLDLGAGSGILAIAAAKLGYAPVRALDNDSDAVRIARQNARRNRVERRVRIECLELAQAPPPKEGYNLVCANLMANLLIEKKQRIASQVKRGGFLTLAGILEREFTKVASAYRECGFEVIDSVRESGWRSGLFGSG